MPINNPMFRIRKQRQREEDSSEGARSEQSAERCTGEERLHENHVERPNIHDDGRVVSSSDHMICGRPNDQERSERYADILSQILGGRSCT